MSLALGLAPSYDVPFVSIDLETTGLPRKVDIPGPWGNARIIEIGAVLITAELALVNPRAVLIHQPEAHLLSPQARQAQKTHQIQPSWVLDRGLPEQDVVDRFCAYLRGEQAEHCPGRPLALRAWNQPFEVKMLGRSPWSEALATLEAEAVITWGEDLATTTAIYLKEDKGETFLNGRPIKNKVKLELAAAYFEMEYSNHRALGDAELAGAIVAHIERERRTTGRPRPQHTKPRAAKPRRAKPRPVKPSAPAPAPAPTPPPTATWQRYHLRTTSGELLIVERRIDAKTVKHLQLMVARDAQRVALDQQGIHQHTPLLVNGRTVRVAEVITDTAELYEGPEECAPGRAPAPAPPPDEPAPTVELPPHRQHGPLFTDESQP